MEVFRRRAFCRWSSNGFRQCGDGRRRTRRGAGSRRREPDSARAGSSSRAPTWEQCPAPHANSPWSGRDHRGATARSSFRLPTPSAPSVATVTGLAWVNKDKTPSYPLVNKDRTDRSEATTGSGRIRSKKTALGRWTAAARDVRCDGVWIALSRDCDDRPAWSPPEATDEDPERSWRALRRSPRSGGTPTGGREDMQEQTSRGLYTGTRNRAIAGSQKPA
jgi:hypothetical protein